MPIYEFLCPKCNERFEELHPSYDVEIAVCPVCRQDSPRQISHSSFILRGSGWYSTDYSPRTTSTTNN